ncbi:porphyrin biosynthesis protein, partial [Stenotrophomonas sp. HMWF022]
FATLQAQCLTNALRLQRGEDSVALVRASAAATDTPLHATVEEQSIAPLPPVYDANEERDEFGNPRLP